MKKLTAVAFLSMLAFGMLVNPAISGEAPNQGQLLNMYEKLDSQVVEIRAQMKRGELNSRHIQDLIEHRNPFLLKKEESVRAENTFPLKVNYDLSVESLVAHGKYDWKNDNITSKNFPTTRKGTAELDIILVHLDRDVSTEEAIKELDKLGLRPAELQELLAFGAKYPDEQRKYPIVALGSVWRSLDVRLVPYLWSGGDRRVLYLHWFVSDWHAFCRFAGVRK